jgi:hypothetical protein
MTCPGSHPLPGAIRSLTASRDRGIRSPTDANASMEGQRMRQTQAWLPKAMALVVMLMAGVAAMTSTESAGTAMTQPRFVASAEFAPCDDLGSVASQAEALPTVLPDIGVIAPEPAAICRLLPQCSADSDCDTQCGTGLGKCVHNNCPARICRCR